MPGPFAAATLARLEALGDRARWLRGNGEREVAEAVSAPARAPDDLVAVTAAATAAEVGEDRARALARCR